MHISAIALRNFRCFGPSEVTVALDPFSAFVGTNGAGKTAVLQALTRLFGTNQSERTILPSDFHLPTGASRDDLKSGETLELSIDVRFAFPELSDAKSRKDAVAACFSQMMVMKPGEDPVCRIRLEATWTKSNLPEGEVEQRLVWVRSDSKTPKEEDISQVSPHDRALIHVFYVPASRDPNRQLKYVAGTIVNSLFKAINWSEEITTEVEAASEEVLEAFGKEPGITHIEGVIGKTWKALHAGRTLRAVKLRPEGHSLDEMLRHMKAVFSPGNDGTEEDLDRLSDGLKSLFYFTIVASGFKITSEVLGGDVSLGKIFMRKNIDSPVLTVFGVEEPENHVAPHYLGRIVSLLREIVDSERAQVVLTSHSPEVLKRVNPLEVRHARLDRTSMVTAINRICLPATTTEAFKYVREGVQAFPELYFSQLVVLGEGDSEEIVIPKIASAVGVEFDLSFVSMAPLGGRHVNHFWRLLNDLEIPHVTLLDLDRERHGGGWGRIQYAIKQLLAVGRDKTEVLKVSSNGKDTVLSDDDFGKMAEWDVGDTALMKSWLSRLETFGVFFSGPLDFDFSMLQRFPDAYKKIEDGQDGPTIPKSLTDAEGKAALKRVIEVVLKPKGGDGRTYKEEEQADFFWYRYLFLGRGKPVSHLRAIAQIEAKDLRASCPKVIERLVLMVKKILFDDPEIN